MIGLKAAPLVAPLIILLGLSLASASETVAVTKAFDGREIKVKTGGLIRVELEQSGTAGYTWEIQGLDSGHFDVVSVKTPEPEGTGGVVTAPVPKIWVILAKAKGKGRLKFIHFRPREGQARATDSFVLTVRIL
jgi:predicted secreted protein